MHPVNDRKVGPGPPAGQGILHAPTPPVQAIEAVRPNIGAAEGDTAEDSRDGTFVLQKATEVKPEPLEQGINKSHLGHDSVPEANLQTYKKLFEELKMVDSETMDEFGTRVTSLVSTIRGLGEKLDKIEVMRKFLRAVPAMQLVTIIEQYINLKTLSIENLVGPFKAYDERPTFVNRQEREKLKGKKTGDEGSSSGGQNGDRSGSHSQKPQKNGS